MSISRKLWIGVIVLVVITIALFFVGTSLWGNGTYAPNYVASIAGAGLGGALSLIVVMISLTITQQRRQGDLSYARFAYLRRQGERLWQAYVAFCQSLGVSTSTVDTATWNSTDRSLWPDGTRASELHRLVREKVKTITPSPGNTAVDLMDAYDGVFVAVSDTALFEGEHSLARDITEAWRRFGWACTRVQDYQGKIGWTEPNWPQITSSIEETSQSVSNVIATLAELGKKARIE